MSFKVCALTVTYGDRFSLVKQTVERVLSEGAVHCVIVDNASSEESAQNLASFSSSRPEITLLRMSENLGSAGGYKVGLETIERDLSCDYILLLDDDNLIEEGALRKLQATTTYMKDFPHPYALLCYREIFGPQTEFMQNGCDFQYKFNSFASTNTLKNIIKKIKKIFPLTNTPSPSFFPLVRIDGASYGGFFFHKNLLSLLGYPREDFFVYIDDLEYTYRLTAKGGYIFSCSEIAITDTDVSWDNNQGFWLFQKQQSPTKIYYYLRNATYWYSRQFKTNAFLYFLNMVLWFTRVILGGIPHPRLFLQRFPLILRAIRDGQKGRLGRTL